jgi:hypothetical protein
VTLLRELGRRRLRTTLTVLGIENPLEPAWSYGSCTWGSTAATPAIALIRSATNRSTGTRPTPIPLLEPSLTSTLPS